MSNSMSSGVFSMTRPFSLAKCNKQMKQKLVEISSMTGLEYTDCKSFMTSVNLSVVSAAGVGSGAGVSSVGVRGSWPWGDD
jgi:hypothetical protein